MQDHLAGFNVLGEMYDRFFSTKSQPLAGVRADSWKWDQDRAFPPVFDCKGGQALGLCEVVGALTDAVAATTGSPDRWHDLLMHILRAAPLYRDAGRLAAWDEAYRYARYNRGIEERSSPTVELLDAIADLGTYNMYAAFDATGTMEEYNRLVQKFEALGVIVPVISSISDW